MFAWHMVAIAQLVERRLVVPDVAGSSPVSHPKFVKGDWPGPSTFDELLALESADDSCECLPCNADEWHANEQQHREVWLEAQIIATFDVCA